jgi:hypothetical protein
MSQHIAIEIADLTKGEDGIIRVVFNETARHDLEDAKAIVQACIGLADGVPCGVIADIRRVTVGANRQAREYYVTGESGDLKAGMAMLVDSPLQRMLGNIFFLLSRPPYPTKMFGDEASAVAWLSALPSKS